MLCVPGWKLGYRGREISETFSQTCLGFLCIPTVMVPPYTDYPTL
jgi:hypothetical protein